MGKWKKSNVFAAATSASQQGLSLIGVLTALLLLGSATIAIAQLMARTEHTVSNSREKFIAANLAREGLELVQAYRDSNWLAAEARIWTEDICLSDSEQSFTIEFNPDVQDDRIFINHITSSEGARLYRTPQGRWTHISGGQDSTRTPYRRTMVVDCAQQAADPAAITVSAQINWDRGGQDQQVVVKQALYNWYKKPV